MAGSYNHLLNDDGTFRFDMIENMGDAHEACQQCFAIIQHLAGGSEEKIQGALDSYYKSVNPDYERGEELVTVPETRAKVSLRDQFAMAALPSILAAKMPEGTTPNEAAEKMAKSCFRMADAMMKERDK